MSELFEFQKSHSMSGRLCDLSPEQFLKLIDGVCLALEDRDLAFHGGVYAANISMDEDGNVGLGAPLAEDTHYTADEIEYIAPEVFWENTRSKQGDVYALGMLMYAWSNGGNLPFLYPNATPSDRAESLRRKMSGEHFELPDIADSLTPVIKKATAFKSAERYKSVSSLHKALEPFRQEVEADSSLMSAKLAALKDAKAQEAMMMANILAAAEAAASTVDRNAPKPKKKTGQQARNQAPAKKEEKKSMSLRPLIAVLLVAAILMVAAVAMQFGADNTTIDNLNGTNATPVVPTADPNATPDITPYIDVTPIVADDGTVITDPTVTDNPLVTDPTPTPTTVVTIDTSRYTVVKSDMSWSVAADNCIASGATLATPRTKDEFNGLTALADRYGLEMVWVGGFRKSGSIVWLSGETTDYMPWAAGEPSYRDTNGTQENFIMLVKLDGVWAYNDVMDNPAAAYPAVYSGKMGYILQR